MREKFGMADSVSRQTRASKATTDLTALNGQPTASAVALDVATSFYRDTQACKSKDELVRVHQIYRDKILAIGKLAGNLAAAFDPVFRGTAFLNRRGTHADIVADLCPNW